MDNVDWTFSAKWDDAGTCSDDDLIKLIYAEKDHYLHHRSEDGGSIGVCNVTLRPGQLELLQEHGLAARLLYDGLYRVSHDQSLLDRLQSLDIKFREVMSQK
jgi:hypothetical protein